jgi:hypothetical protein
MIKRNGTVYLDDDYSTLEFADPAWGGPLRVLWVNRGATDHMTWIGVATANGRRATLRPWNVRVSA